MRPPVLPRSCGSCRACCIHVKVEAFDKPAGTACEKLLPVLVENPDAGGCCSIYDQRPSECRQYTCSWLEGVVPESLSPARCGCIFETAWFRYPRTTRLLMAFEYEPKLTDAMLDELEAGLPAGTVCGLVRHGQQQPLYIGAADDLAAMAEFFRHCQHVGSIQHQFADGEVNQPLPQGATT